MNAETDFSIMTYFNVSEEGYFAGFKSICETRDYILLNEAGENQYFLVDKRKMRVDVTFIMMPANRNICLFWGFVRQMGIIWSVQFLISC